MGSANILRVQMLRILRLLAGTKVLGSEGFLLPSSSVESVLSQKILGL